VKQRTEGAILLELVPGPRERLAVAYPAIESRRPGNGTPRPRRTTGSRSASSSDERAPARLRRERLHGELIAREAAHRGLAPVLAGRSKEAVAALAGELGCEFRVFGLGDPARVAAASMAAGVVIHCAGPFSATAAPMIEACIGAGVHYADITGEIEVFEHAWRQDAKARAAGVVLCRAPGFDVVPTDCLALTLSDALPGAVKLSLGFDSRSPLSRGTAATSIEGLGRGSCVRERGELRRIPLGSRARRIDFGAGEKLATAIPWGDVSTAYRTTGILNVEVYIPVSPKALANLKGSDGSAGCFAAAASRAS
jgi:short subunit dehydrogenase-like uncharacterized protein